MQSENVDVQSSLSCGFAPYFKDVYHEYISIHCIDKPASGF